MPRTFKFVISGGPCAGKTTAMERLRVFLRERGFRVFVVPEAATMLWVHGAFHSDLNDPKCAFAFQQFVIRTQIQLEDSFLNYAKCTGCDSIILCDRGTMDGSAYVSREDWLKVVNDVGIDEVTLRDQRYDVVYHLVTAADGAEAFYSLANNAGRSESLAAAKMQDKRTQEAWAGHPHHIIIDNRNTFEQKMERLISLISRAVGLPSLARKAYKYLVKKPDISKLPDAQCFDVEKVILVSGTSFHDTHTATAGDNSGKVLYSFIRKRSQNGSNSYGLTTVKQLDNGERVELKNIIADKVYEYLKSTSADSSRHVILQKRYYFLWNKQSFQLYEHMISESDITPAGGLKRSGSSSSQLASMQQDGLCTLYCQSEGDPILPEFIEVIKNFGCEGDDEEFSAYNLSKRDDALDSEDH